MGVRIRTSILDLRLRTESESPMKVNTDAASVSPLSTLPPRASLEHSEPEPALKSPLEGVRPDGEALEDAQMPDAEEERQDDGQSSSSHVQVEEEDTALDDDEEL